MSRSGGQARDRTADLPLFRSRDHRLGASMLVVCRAQKPSVASDRPRCTEVNETKNETIPGAPKDGHARVAAARRELILYSARSLAAGCAEYISDVLELADRSLRGHGEAYRRVLLGAGADRRAAMILVPKRCRSR